MVPDADEPDVNATEKISRLLHGRECCRTRRRDVSNRCSAGSGTAKRVVHPVPLYVPVNCARSSACVAVAVNNTVNPSTVARTLHQLCSRSRYCGHAKCETRRDPWSDRTDGQSAGRGSSCGNRSAVASGRKGDGGTAHHVAIAIDNATSRVRRDQYDRDGWQTATARRQATPTLPSARSAARGGLTLGRWNVDWWGVQPHATASHSPDRVVLRALRRCQVSCGPSVE